MSSFGKLLRSQREELSRAEKGYSLRKVAEMVGIQPSYLSKIERDQEPPPGEETVKKLAEVLGYDPDVLLAAAGKISSDLKDVILKRPALVGQLMRQVREAPDSAILRVVREVRDGNW